MVRLSDMTEIEAKFLRAVPCEPFKTEPWVPGAPLTERRVAIVTTAWLHDRAERNFTITDASYRVIPADMPGRDLAKSHISTNVDTNGFQQDVNVVFPIDRLRELEDAGEIGSLASFHYSFMAATSRPRDFEPAAREVAGMLKEDGVNAVLLCPV
jgi:D-proline reductase (dithiol) PrdB